MNANYKTNLTSVTNEAAIGDVKTIFEGSTTQLGFVPNMYRTMGNSHGYLSTYMHGYQAFRQSSNFTPIEQEIVFLVISRKNGCDYCTAAHSMIADKVAKFAPDVLEAIRADKPVPDPKLQALATMTSSLFEKRGLVTKEDVQSFLAAGYGEEKILEIILAISVKTLSNYSNHIFHTDLDAAFQNYEIGQQS